MTTIRAQDVPYLTGRQAKPGAINPYPTGSHDAARWAEGYLHRRPVKSQPVADEGEPSANGVSIEAIRGPGYHWSDDELRFLRENYGKYSVREIAKTLSKRSVEAIQMKASLMGLKANQPAPEWTVDDTRDLRRYLNLGLTIEDMARLLCREPADLERWANKIGINLKSRKAIKRRSASA
jgi:hypothetical protein